MNKVLFKLLYNILIIINNIIMIIKAANNPILYFLILRLNFINFNGL